MISDLAIEKIEKEEREIEMTLLSLVYKGWSMITEMLEGQVYRSPDIVQFPQSIFRGDDVFNEECRKSRKK